jgi:hypothetical protein
MLRELLYLLREGKILSQYDLAERLHTTPEMIASSIDFLHRTGHLRNICSENRCGKKCSGCKFSSMPLNAATLWEMVRYDEKY